MTGDVPEPPPLPFQALPEPAEVPLRKKRMGRRTKVVLVALITVASLGLLALFGIGVLVGLGAIPDTVAVRGADLSDTARDFLREAGIVSDDEKVLYFYSGGFFSYGEDGNLFTDHRVISYWEDDAGDRIVVDAAYAEISSIEITARGGLLEDTTIEISCHDGTSFDLYVSAEDDGDERFHDLLVQTWKQKR